jgi:hypothetical protein
MTVSILSNCMFISSIILLLIIILLLMVSLPPNAVLLVLVFEIVKPYFDVILPNLCTDFCNKVSDSAIIT